MTGLNTVKWNRAGMSWPRPGTSCGVRVPAVTSWKCTTTRPAARSLGPPDLPVHGLLKTAWLTTLVEEWLDGRGRIRHLDVTYRRMDFRNQPIECLLAVRSSTPRGATLQLSTLNASGETTTTATATVESTPHHQPGGRFSSPLVGWRASRRRP